MTEGNYVPLFTDEEISDLFNAVDVLRNLHLNSSSKRMTELVEQYAYGTRGNVRAAALYKKVERLINLKVLSMPDIVLESMMEGDLIQNG